MLQIRERPGCVWRRQRVRIKQDRIFLWSRVQPSPQQPEWDFFIAHASADQGRAEELYALLYPSSRVFLDSRCLLLGDNWDAELSKAQSRSRITIVLISSHTNDAYYEREEIATAIDMSRGDAGRHRVVPILLEDVGNEAVPYGLRRKHSITLDARGMQAVAAALTDLLARLSGRPPTIAATSETADVRRVYDICGALSYDKLAKSRLALRDLDSIAKQGSRAAREAVITELKEFLLDLDELRWFVIPNPVRDLRKSALDVIRTAADGKLFRHFERGEFEGIDLYGMNFRFEDLSGVSFAKCFLVEANFAGANLTGVSFSGARIRNADFAGANLSGADFSLADWFNALGLSEANLGQARRETLFECPADIDRMYDELKRWYALQFHEWSANVQQQLLVTWREYLCPGGLREITEKWKTHS
jgi:hypothetical protein